MATQLNMQQRHHAQSFMNSCESYLFQLIDLHVKSIPSAQVLAEHPETMDKLINVYRARDMCYAFLIDPDTRIIGHNLTNLTSTQIDHFFTTYDPIHLCEFFAQHNVVNDFILANELDQPKAFDNDQKYQTAFQTMIKPL